jgi:hypothetical protein
MTDPQQVIVEIGNDAERLDTLEKLIGEATDLFTATEERWEEVLDAVGESLKREYEDAGRKTDPAEHTIKAEARRQDRVAYVNYQRAAHAVKKLEKQIKAKQAALSGRQSQLSALRDEARVSQGPQPQWSGSRR